MKSSKKMLTNQEAAAMVNKIRAALNEEYGKIPDENQEIVRVCRQGMMPIPKAVGFDATQWDMKYLNAQTREDRDNLIWKTAQSDLLADPMVIDLRGVEWPDWAETLNFIWSDRPHGLDTDRYIYTKRYAFIKRPTPTWQPKEGEAVFINRGDNVAEIAKFCRVAASGILWVITTIKGQDQCHKPENIKPFDPAKIGLSWEEI